jgi:hypothetical protein
MAGEHFGKKMRRGRKRVGEVVENDSFPSFRLPGNRREGHPSMLEGSARKRVQQNPAPAKAVECMLDPSGRAKWKSRLKPGSPNCGCRAGTAGRRRHVAKARVGRTRMEEEITVYYKLVVKSFEAGGKISSFVT